MMRAITFSEACEWYNSLSSNQRIPTLSPKYVVLDSLRDPSLQPQFIGWRRGSEFWMHGTHRSIAAGTGVIDLQSPYGYGGPLSNSSDAGFLNAAWQKYVDFCRKQGWLAEFVRFHPLMKLNYDGIVIKERNTVVVDLKAQNIRSTYSTRCRTSIRKALAQGLEVRLGVPEELEQDFPNFYREGMKAIGADAFYLFNDRYFEQFSKWQDAQLLICYRGDEWLSAGIFLSQGDYIEYHLSATVPSGRNFGATNLLLDYAAHLGKEQSRSYLYLGGGTSSDESNPLYFFKKSFSSNVYPFFIGFTPFDEIRYSTLKNKYMNENRPVNRFLFYRQ